MNFYKDLTYYSDCHFENAINIGWIAPNEKWRNTEVDNGLINKLLQYMSYRLNQYRGGNYLKKINIFGEKYMLGYSEMRIISHDLKRKYAVSDIIFFAMFEQGYRPPQAFVDDLVTAIPTDSKNYQTYLKNYNQSSFWGESEEYVISIEELTNLIVNGDQERLMQKINHNKQLLDIVTQKGSLLNTAIVHEKTNIALSLIEKGIDINKFNGIELLSAIKTQQKDVIDILVDKQVLYRDYNHEVNPLFYAIRHHNLDAIKKLLDSKYDLFRTYNNEFVRDFSVLECVNRFGNQEVKEFFKGVESKPSNPYKWNIPTK